MVDAKLTALPFLASLSEDDLLYIVDDPHGNPTSKQTSIATVAQYMTAPINVLNYGAKGDGVTDDTAAIQDALNAVNANNFTVFIPARTYKVTGTLLPKLNTQIFGQGVANTILDFGAYNGICLYAPGQQSILDGFQIKGSSAAASIGLQIDKTHRPYHCKWGSIKIIGFHTGLFIYNDGGGADGFYDNDFGNVWTESCTHGVVIQATSQIINANIFRMLSAINCTEGVYLENVGGLLIEYLHVENGTTGINVVKGIGINILDGHLEGLTTNIIVANNPDVMGFRYWGVSDDFDTGYTYVSSDNRSDLLAFSAGGLYYRMAGRWWFDTLEATKTYALTLRSPGGIRYSINVSDIGALLIQAI